jgi:hypothetical protein
LTTLTADNSTYTGLPPAPFPLVAAGAPAGTRAILGVLSPASGRIFTFRQPASIASFFSTAAAAKQLPVKTRVDNPAVLIHVVSQSALVTDYLGELLKFGV